MKDQIGRRARALHWSSGRHNGSSVMCACTSTYGVQAAAGSGPICKHDDLKSSSRSLVQFNTSSGHTLLQRGTLFCSFEHNLPAPEQSYEVGLSGLRESLKREPASRRILCPVRHSYLGLDRCHSKFSGLGNGTHTHALQSSLAAKNESSCTRNAIKLRCRVHTDEAMESCTDSSRRSGPEALLL